MPNTFACPTSNGLSYGWREHKWVENNWEPDAVDQYIRYFPQGFAPPRVCSFCGSVHPDDALQLIAQGWEVEETTREYKRWLKPPGYSTWMTSLTGKVGQSIGRPVRTPVPPVPLYTQHFSDKQMEQFNIQLMANINRQVPPRMPA